MNRRLSVEFSDHELRQLMRTLEEVVVSLDHIGAMDGTDRELADWAWQYLTVHGAARALSEARAGLYAALDRSLPESDVDGMLAGLTFWNDRHFPQRG